MDSTMVSTIALSCAADESLLHTADHGVHGFVGQNSREQRAQCAADGVNAEGVQRVIVAQPGLELPAREEGNDAGHHADDHRPVCIHEAASGSDDHQTRDDAGAETEHARLALDQPFRHGPDKTRRGCGERGGGEGIGGHAVRRQRAAGIEAIPAHPEHAGADHTQHHAVRRHGFSCRKPSRLPRIKHRISADQPEDMWTTVPPAKSIALIEASGLSAPFMKPSAAQTMWASGK